MRSEAYSAIALSMRVSIFGGEVGIGQGDVLSMSSKTYGDFTLVFYNSA